MIAAIEAGFGLKEERPALPVDKGGDPGFSRELSRVDTRSSRESEPTREVARPGADPTARAQYGHATGEAPEAKPAAREKSARGEGDDLDSAAARKQPESPHLQHAEGDDSQDDVPAPQGAAAAMALVLPPGENPTQLRTPHDVAPAHAQVGMAAWRLGEHSAEEAAAAAKAGVVLPGTEVVTGTPATAQAAAMQHADPQFAPAAADASGESAQTLIRVHADPQADPAAPSVSENPQADLEEGVQQNTAQARNRLLGRLGHAAHDAGGNPAAQPQVKADAQAEAQAQLQGQGQGQTGQPGGAFDPRLAIRHPLHEGLGSGRNDGAALQQGRDSVGHLASHTTAPDATLGLGTAHAAGQAAHSAQAALARSDVDEASARQLIDRVAEQARWLIGERRSEVTMKLHPEHLGQLHMKIVHKDGLLRVDLTVDNLGAKHLLEQHLADLRQRLEGQQPSGDAFQFNVDVRQGQQSHRDMYAAQPEGPRMERIPGRPEVEPVAHAGLRRPAWSNHSVSIYA